MSPDIPSRSNADWIVLIRRGDPDACNDVLRLCKMVCMRQLASWSEADPDDAAQDAAIKVILTARKPDFAIQSSFPAFVMSVAVRCACDVKRRIHRERTLSMPLDAHDQLAAAGPAQETPVDLARNALLDSCIGQLSAQDQQIMQWRAAGQGPAWIAETLGPPANRNAIGVRIHRLCARLRQCLGMGHVVVAVER